MSEWDLTEGELPTHNQETEKTSGGAGMRSVLKLLMISVLIALFVTQVLIVNAEIPSESMLPTLQIGDRVIADRIAIRLDKPIERQKLIVIYKDIRGQGVKEYYLKRVIGVPGDNVDIQDGQLLINGNVSDEPYLLEPMAHEGEWHFEVPEGKYFVLGDNRNNSFDSRYWSVPMVDYSEIKGVVFYQYFKKCRKL